MAKNRLADWDTTAANNTDVGGINIDEGWAPENVNNAARETMSQLAEFHKDIGGTITSTNVANAYSITTNDGVSAYAAGQIYTFIVNAVNTGAATLNVNTIGAKSIVKNHDVALAAGDLEANQICVVAYGATDDTFQLLSQSGTTPGVILQTVEATPYASYSTHNTIIPEDDTIPQNTEGSEIITVAITPENAANRLVIECDMPVISSGSNYNATAALFQDTTADALAVATIYCTTLDLEMSLRLKHEMAAGTTSSTTFKIRIGPSQAGSIYLNGSSTARLYGGISKIRLSVTEIKV